MRHKAAKKRGGRSIPHELMAVASSGFRSTHHQIPTKCSLNTACVIDGARQGATEAEVPPSICHGQDHGECDQVKHDSVKSASSHGWTEGDVKYWGRCRGLNVWGVSCERF